MQMKALYIFIIKSQNFTTQLQIMRLWKVQRNLYNIGLCQLWFLMYITPAASLVSHTYFAPAECREDNKLALGETSQHNVLRVNMVKVNQLKVKNTHVKMVTTFFKID